MFKLIFPYLLILFLSLLPRLYSLGTIPTSLAHDEVDMIIQAHSLRLTGTDLSGTWSPWSLLPNDAVMAELGPAVNLPTLSLLPNSLFAAHATSALLSSLYPLVLVLVLLSLGFSRRLSWFSGYALALSPWHILFSRTSLEQPTSLFFYTLSWLSLSTLFKAKNKKSILLSTFTFLTFYSIGFYTYHGYKFALPLLTVILSLYHSYRQKRYLPLLIVALITGGLYLRIMANPSSYLSRGGEIAFLDKSRFSQVVDYDRRLSLLPDSLTQVFSNKPQAIVSLAVDKYLSVFSPDQLFTKGEKNGVFSTGRTGYLYLFLAPFVVIGFASLVTSGKSRDLLLLVLFLLSPLATVLHTNTSFAFRSAIFVVLLTVLSAKGVEVLAVRYSRLKVTLIAAALTLLSAAHFGYVYFGLYPVESSRAYFFGDRTLGTYLSHRSSERILVIDPQPRYIMSYLVLTNPDITREVIAPLIGRYDVGEENNIYTLGSLTIRRDCPATLTESYDTVIVDFTLVEGLDQCPPLLALQVNNQLSVRKIVDPLDSGVIKYLYNDKICDDLTLSPYLSLDKVKDFGLEKMSRVQFCSRWIIAN
ncbi:MAG: hypothetical protein DPW11_00855 [bacterium]|nr:hypothetical protein [Candidatus Microgenomates bacterium CPR3]MCQ3944317.1 hypothetical protein [bacterium]